jgi:hypothetical protein
MHPAELGELEAFRDLYAAAPEGVGARAEEIGGGLCLRLEAAPTSAMFNRALGLGLREAATEEALEQSRPSSATRSAGASPSLRRPGRRSCRHGSSTVVSSEATAGRSSGAGRPIHPMRRRSCASSASERTGRTLSPRRSSVAMARRASSGTGSPGSPREKGGTASSPSTARHPQRQVRSTQPARSVGSESPRRFLRTGARADRARSWPRGSRPPRPPAARS